MSQRKMLPIEKKIAIVKALNDGKRVEDLAKANGIHKSSIYDWSRKLKKKAVHPRKAKTQNNVEIIKDLDHLVQENEFLKMMCKNLMKLLELNTEKK